MSKSKKTKLFIGLGAGGIVSIIAVIVFIFIMLNAFKVPNLMENITKWQFVRITNQVRIQNQRVVNTKIAIDSTDVKERSALRQKYGKYMGQFDQYRPAKVAANIYAADKIEYRYTGNKLTAVTINGKTNLYPKPTLGTKLIPGYKFYRDSTIAASLAPEVDAQYFKQSVLTATGTDKIGFLVRSQVNNQIRQQLGISLVAWKVGQFAGKDKVQSRLIAERLSNERIATSTEAKPRTAALSEAVDDLKETTATEIKDDNKLQQSWKNNGVLPGVKTALENSVKSSVYQKTLEFVNPLYGIATPICIVYDGSMSNSKELVDAQSASQIKSYNLLASVADQTKDGEAGSAEALGAFSEKIGDDRNVPAYQRADGNTVSTDGAQSAQSSAGGSFTLFNAMFGGDSTTAGAANALADQTCAIMLNTGVAITVGGLNIAATFLTGGASGAATKAAGATAQTVVKRATTKIVDKMLGRAITTKVAGEVASKTASQKIKYILGRSALEASATAGATLLAKSIVAGYAGEYYNGLEQGTDIINSADAGANLNANELMRQQNYGRPLNQVETKQAYAQTVALVAQENSKKSVYQRYIALNNADSVLTRVASGMTSMNFKTFSSYLNPGKLFSSVSRTFNPRAMAAATANADNISFGNVQWGWSDEEQKLLEQDESYSYLENQRILDESGRMGDIESTYGKCFSGDDENTQGGLLQSGAITRDDDGNLLEQGDCAPGKLGIRNPDYGDLVFRYRIAKSDDQSLKDQVNLQSVTESATTGTDDNSSMSSDVESEGGWTWPVGKNDYPGRLSQCIKKPGHTGIDIPVPTGTNVLAAKSGRVAQTDPSGRGAAGKYIIIDHGGGKWTNYQHNSEIKVKPEQLVKAGDLIALSGNTGFSTGPHVHFSVTTQLGLDSRNKVTYSIDPLQFLPKDRKYSCG